MTAEKIKFKLEQWYLFKEWCKECFKSLIPLIREEITPLNRTCSHYIWELPVSTVNVILSLSSSQSRFWKCKYKPKAWPLLTMSLLAPKYCVWWLLQFLGQFRSTLFTSRAVGGGEGINKVNYFQKIRKNSRHSVSLELPPFSLTLQRSHGEENENLKTGSGKAFFKLSLFATFFQNKSFPRASSI